MCKNLDGENLANFGQSSISPNFSGAKVSLYTVVDFCKHGHILCYTRYSIMQKLSNQHSVKVIGLMDLEQHTVRDKKH